MKKVITMLIVAIMLVTMCSCGASTNKTSEETTVAETLDGNRTEQNAPDTKTLKVKNNYVVGDEITDFPQAAEKTLCDTSGYKVVFKGLEYANKNLIVNLTFENKTGESISFDRGFFFVNEWNVESAVWYTRVTVNPFASAEAEFSIPLWELEFRHVKTINKISFNFVVGGEKTELFTIETDAKDKDTSFVPEGEVVYENNGVRAILPESGCIDKANNGLCVYIENNSDKPVIVNNSLTPPEDEAYKYNGKGVILYPHTKDIYFGQLEIYKIRPGSKLTFCASSTEYNLDEMSYDKFSRVYGEEYTLEIVE